MTNFDVRRRVYEHAPRAIPSDVFNVLVFLSHLANADGVCWPKNETIAYNARLDERRVRRAIKWLEDHGQLIVNRRAGRGRCSYYGIITGLDDRAQVAVARAMEAAEQAHTKPTADTPFSDEKVRDVPPIREKRGQIKGGKSSADFGAVTRNDDQINEYTDPEIIDPTTPLPPAEVAAAAPPILDAPQRGGGGGGGEESAPRIGRAAAPPPAHPETIRYLQALPNGERVSMAAACGDIPLDVAQAAYRDAKRSPGVKSVAGATYGYLQQWRAGNWQPPPAAAPPPVEPPPPAELAPVLSAEERRRISAARGWRKAVGS